MFTSRQLFERRRARNRAAVKRVSSGQPRLSVHRSSKHIYAQVIDDSEGHTVAAASTLDNDINLEGSTSNAAAAAAVGKLVAERAKANGVEVIGKWHGLETAARHGLRAQNERVARA